MDNASSLLPDASSLLPDVVNHAIGDVVGQETIYNDVVELIADQYGSVFTQEIQQLFENIQEPDTGMVVALMAVLKELMDAWVTDLSEIVAKEAEPILSGGGKRRNIEFGLSQTEQCAAPVADVTFTNGVTLKEGNGTVDLYLPNRDAIRRRCSNDTWAPYEQIAPKSPIGEQLPVGRRHDWLCCRKAAGIGASPVGPSAPSPSSSPRLPPHPPVDASKVADVLRKLITSAAASVSDAGGVALKVYKEQQPAVQARLKQTVAQYKPVVIEFGKQQASKVVDQTVSLFNAITPVVQDGAAKGKVWAAAKLKQAAAEASVKAAEAIVTARWAAMQGKEHIQLAVVPALQATQRVAAQGVQQIRIALPIFNSAARSISKVMLSVVIHLSLSIARALLSSFTAAAALAFKAAKASGGGAKEIVAALRKASPEYKQKLERAVRQCLATIQQRAPTYADGLLTSASAGFGALFAATRYLMESAMAKVAEARLRVASQRLSKKLSKKPSKPHGTSSSTQYASARSTDSDARGTQYASARSTDGTTTETTKTTKTTEQATQYHSARSTEVIAAKPPKVTRRTRQTAAAQARATKPQGPAAKTRRTQKNRKTNKPRRVTAPVPVGER